MATEAEINARIAALEAALGDGTLTVEYDGRRLTYRSVAEIERALARLRGDLVTAQGGTRTRRFAVIAEKGL